MQFHFPWPRSWSVEAVIEQLEPMVFERRKARIVEVLRQRLSSVTLLLDELDDPHNRAAIVRSCDAFGVQSLHVLQQREAFGIHHGIAAGTERWVDVHAHASPEAAVAHLRQLKYELIATHPEGELEPEALASIPRVALILGNEHRGIQPSLASAAGRRVKIPMCGFVESLNVSVSAAVLLRAATRTRAGDLAPDQARFLYARALYFTVPRAEEVLNGLLARSLPSRSVEVETA